MLDGKECSLSSETESHLEDDSLNVLSKGISNSDSRHIKAENFEWAKSSISTLADIVIENCTNIESFDLNKFLQNASPEQQRRILDLLPLDYPLQVTLNIIEDEIYWKRLCLKSWPAWDVWRYSDNWKSMFVHRSVQQLIENFMPDKDNFSELRKSLEVFSQHVLFLQIGKLMKRTPKEMVLDVFSENLDQQLDDIISSSKQPIYLDFEKVFDIFPYLKSLNFTLSPTCVDFEYFHFNNADFNSFFRALRKMEGLKEFRITNRILYNEQLTIVLKMFSTHKALTKLDLSFNFIDDCTINYIARLLLSECPLKSIILMYNKITDEGAKSLASVLLENSKLGKLDLSLNTIGDKGAVAIAKALLENDSLTDLDLSKNKIREEGGIHIARLINESKTLRSFKIQENFLGENAGKQILNAVKQNPYIIELGVKLCGFTAEDEGLIHHAILQNRSKLQFSTYIRNSEDSTASEFLF